MKAERRHELQENELAKVIKKAPNFWQESGGKALAVAVAILVIVILVRYRISANRTAAAQAVETLSSARTLIDELNSPMLLNPMTPPNELANQRRVRFNEANNAIGQAIQLSDDKKIQAEALLAKGDLSWTLAQLPAVAGAATQPSLVVKDPKELLSNAHDAYQQIVTSYADQKYAYVAARLGLAAIAENRGEWDQAKQQYEKVAAETKDMPAYQQLAAMRLARLSDIRNPVILGTPTSMPAMPDLANLPATRPVPEFLRPPTTAAAATSQPAPGAAATRPATQAAAAAAPSTGPATAPAIAAAPATTAPATSQPK